MKPMKMTKLVSAPVLVIAAVFIVGVMAYVYFAVGVWNVIGAINASRDSGPICIPIRCVDDTGKPVEGYSLTSVSTNSNWPGVLWLSNNGHPVYDQENHFTSDSNGLCHVQLAFVVNAGVELVNNRGETVAYLQSRPLPIRLREGGCVSRVTIDNPQGEGIALIRRATTQNPIVFDVNVSAEGFSEQYTAILETIDFMVYRIVD